MDVDREAQAYQRFTGKPMPGTDREKARKANGEGQIPFIGPTKDGAEVLNDVRAFMKRFVVFPDQSCADAATLWAAHAHMVLQFHTSPRLAVLSPEAESGKTRLLEILDLLTPHSMLILSPSPAAIFRKLKLQQVTLLFDEVDTIFTRHGKDSENENLRAMLNAGYRKGATIPRCVGPHHEVQDFEVYAATALAGIGNLPNTVMTRSIVIPMKRRAETEPIDEFRLRQQEPEGHKLRDQLARWASKVEKAAGESWPKLPEGITDRRAEAWEPLIAIADQAGGHWPETAREACKQLNKPEARSVSLGVRLLMDLKTIFGEVKALHTRTIIERLCNPQDHGLDADAPWAEIHGNPISDRVLARLLRPYGVASEKVNIDGQSLQGYRREALWDAWNRWIPKAPSAPAGVEHPELAESDGQKQGLVVPDIPDIPLARGDGGQNGEVAV